MKLNSEQKKQKNILLKQAKQFKEKHKLILAIEFLIEKDIDPFMIQLNFEKDFKYKLDNSEIIVYKNNQSRNLNDIMMVVNVNHLDIKEETIINSSQLLFKEFPSIFFILFFNNKKSSLVFKKQHQNKTLINMTNEIPSFNWNN